MIVRESGNTYDSLRVTVRTRDHRPAQPTHAPRPCALPLCAAPHPRWHSEAQLEEEQGEKEEEGEESRRKELREEDLSSEGDLGVKWRRLVGDAFGQRR